MSDEYQISEEDIESVIKYLKIIAPDRATPEVAIEILERMYARTHMLEHYDAKAVEEILKDLEDH